mgnify:FL=1|nr:MAG TPA: hypothetical protein [Caudoviricetes sp.]
MKKEQIIKTDQQLKAIIAANKFHTFDYTCDGFCTSDYIETLDIAIPRANCPIDTFDCYISLYPTYEAFWDDIQSNFIYLDLTKGGDDQYYDYNPSCLEAIVYAIPLLKSEDQDYIITGLKTKLESFIHDEDEDEDMIQQYESIYNALEKYETDHRETELFNELYVSDLLNQINK